MDHLPSAFRGLNRKAAQDLRSTKPRVSQDHSVDKYCRILDYSARHLLRHRPLPHEATAPGHLTIELLFIEHRVGLQIEL